MTSRAAEWLQVPPEGGADGHILIGAPAWFTVDGLGSSTYQGVVEEISPAVGSEFSIMSTDNVIGSFVKILQRISVKIRIDGNMPERLRPGMWWRRSSTLRLARDSGNQSADARDRGLMDQVRLSSRSYGISET